jgi:hypothetical protein
LTSPRTSMTQSAAPGSLTISDDPTASTTDVGCHHNCHVRPVPLGHDRRHCRDAPGATAQPPMLRVQCRRPGFGRRRPRPATRRRPTARDITRPAVGCRRQGREIRPIAIGRAGNASATQSGAGQTDTLARRDDNDNDGAVRPGSDPPAQVHPRMITTTSRPEDRGDRTRWRNDEHR